MVTMTEKDREDAEWSGDPQVLLLWSIVKQAERDQEEAVVRALTAQAWAVACAMFCEYQAEESALTRDWWPDSAAVASDVARLPAPADILRTS